MDLFVVNRPEEHQAVDEEANIARVLKAIEKKKLIRNKQKEKVKEKQKLIAKTRKEREEKRLKKSQFVAVPTITNLIDENIEAQYQEEQQTLANNKPVETKKRNKKRKLDSSNIEGFAVLGGENFEKKLKVKRVLPRWLSTPTVISVNLQELKSKVSSMKELDKGIRKKLKKDGVKYFFPVQAEVIPFLIKSNRQSGLIHPRDICVSAPTGSGKTLAFVLPVVQSLLSYHVKKIRALVILPTQDLAMQVYQCFTKYVQGTHIEVSLITGKISFNLEQQQLVVENEAYGYLSKTDILVCTAGRLVEHLKETKGFNLRELRYLIIDEADRVLDNVQNDWLYHLEKHMYGDEPTDIRGTRILNLLTLKNQREPQKLLFSATLSQDPEKLQKLSLFQPKLFTSVIETNAEKEDKDMNGTNVDTFIGKYTTPKELTEKYIESTVDIKPLVLYQFMKQNNLTKTIVFTHSIESAHRLAILLQQLFKDTLKIEEVSSQLETNSRSLLINNFSNGKIDVLVCTDRLARGIDLVDIQCVISYTAPKYVKTYIHRAGRTARAGKEGLAVTLLDKSNLNKFTNLLQQAGKGPLEEIKLSVDGLESLGEQYKEALENLKKTVSNEEQESIQKMKSAKGRGKKRKFNTKNAKPL